MSELRQIPNSDRSCCWKQWKKTNQKIRTGTWQDSLKAFIRYNKFNRKRIVIAAIIHYRAYLHNCSVKDIIIELYWQIWIKIEAKILPKMICLVFDANSAQGDGEDQEPPCRAVWGGGGPAEKSYFPGIFTFWLKQWKWKGNREKRHRQKHGGGWPQEKREKEFHLLTKTMKMKSNSKRQNDKDKYTG